ncbi:MAG: hypothetical protein IKE55_04920 [Kiritimatiellae bacterium]|nr:hypothetical protein [Kiritimatiellia bacterium]
MKAIDFDDVKRDACDVRIQELRSADAFFKATNGTYYFIEFKNSHQSALDELQFDKGKPIDSRTGLTVTCSYIELVLKQKAFDSLAIAGMTVLQDMPEKDIMDNAVFIVVRLDDTSKSLNGLINNITRLSTGGNTILWGLNELKQNGFFREVYTWTETEFVYWAKTHLT